MNLIPRTLYLAADHAGFSLKESLRVHFSGQSEWHVEDLGAMAFSEGDDYTDYARKLAVAVANHPRAIGIICCGSGEGVCMVANKFAGIRAAIGFSIKAAVASRNDEEANVLCLPGRIETIDDPLKIAEAFLRTPFSGEERHARRKLALDSIL